MNQPALFAVPHRNECVFSPCRRYRYSLRRKISDASSTVLWVMANPSIADEFKLDPTLTRCADYTERWGYGEMRVVNVRAWVETDSSKLPPDDQAIGVENGFHIVKNAVASQLIICGWGKLGGAAGLRALQLLRDDGFKPHALKLNKDGSPQHPLYLKASLKPFPLEAA
jgi:hypothetical protein